MTSLPRPSEIVIFQPSELSARDIGDFLRARLWTILLVAAAAVGAAVFMTFYVLSPDYEASATIIVDPSQVRPVVEAQQPASDLEKVITFQTQIDILKSSTLAAAVVDDLDLTHRRVIGRVERLIGELRALQRAVGVLIGKASWQKLPDPRAEAIAAMLATLNVEAKPQSSVLAISYRCKDPDEAAATVRSLIKVYRTYFNAQLRARAAGIVSYLDAQIADVRAHLKSVEQQILAFKQSDRLVLDEPASARAARSAGPPSLVDVTDSPKVAEELKAYVLAMEDDLRKLETQFAADYPAAVVLRTKIQHYVAALNELPRKEIELLRLRRELDFDQESYKYLKQNIERARIVEISNTSAVGMVSELEPPVPNDKPVAPKPKLILPVALVFGGLLGVVVALGLHYLDQRLYSERDVARHLRMRCIARLPRL